MIWFGDTGRCPVLMLLPFQGMNYKHILSFYCFETVAIALTGLDSTIIIYQMVFNGINSHDVGLENLNSNSYTLKG
jgi:hypothetical protein